jgi:uncharacterized protein with GYD domain
MTKFLIRASYSPEGAKGLLKAGGTSRRAAIEKMITDIGGKLESFYFAFGDDDVYVIAELPDNVSVAAMALTINASSLASIRTTILLSPEDIDKATELSVSYRSPGH